MPFRLGPLDPVFTPKRWPAPNYRKTGEVARAWLPKNITVGHLIRQGKALVWFSAAGPEIPSAYAARLIVDQILRDGLRLGWSVEKTWDKAREAILFEAPILTPLSKITSEYKKIWKTSE